MLAEHYAVALDAVHEWERTGDFAHLASLGLEGKRHPGFPAPSGTFKRDYSPTTFTKHPKNLASTMSLSD